MAVAHRASAVANSTTNTTSLTITIPASVQTNDILFVVTSNGGSTTDPTVTDDDSGGNAWARLGGTNASQASPFVQTSGDVFWKRATAATASKTITVSGCTNTCSAGVSAFSGARTTDPPYENVNAEKNLAGDESNAGFTSSTGGSMVCLAVCNTVDDTAVGSQSCTDPGALTQRFEHLNTAGHACGTNLSSAVQTAVGATGSLTWAQTDKMTVSVGWNILPAGYEIAADPGSYLFTGTVPALTYFPGRRLIAPAGSYAFTGTPATLRLSSKILAVEAGSYLFTGAEATLTYSAIARHSDVMTVRTAQEIIINTAIPQFTVRGKRPG